MKKAKRVRGFQRTLLAYNTFMKIPFLKSISISVPDAGWSLS